MNRKLKIFLISASSCATIGLIAYGSYALFKPNDTNDKSNYEYSVSIDGAVKNPGTYKFKKPLSIREIIFKANVLTNADLSSLDLDKIVDSDYEIVVPYKVDSIKKIKWRDLNSVEQLTKLGIKKSIAQSIINHRRQNETTTWEEILALKGIGQVALAQLKDVIDLS